MGKQNDLCCFRDCEQESSPSLRLQVYLPRDDESQVLFWAHECCFANLCNPAVQPDNPKDHGSIPAQALCVFCGTSLPTVGTHPYVFDVGNFVPPRRYWAHAQCMKQRLDPVVITEL